MRKPIESACESASVAAHLVADDAADDAAADRAAHVTGDRCTRGGADPRADHGVTIAMTHRPASGDRYDCECHRQLLRRFIHVHPPFAFHATTVAARPSAGNRTCPIIL